VVRFFFEFVFIPCTLRLIYTHSPIVYHTRTPCFVACFGYVFKIFFNNISKFNIYIYTHTQHWKTSKIIKLIFFSRGVSIVYIMQLHRNTTYNKYTKLHWSGFTVTIDSLYYFHYDSGLMFIFLVKKKKKIVVFYLGIFWYFYTVIHPYWFVWRYFYLYNFLMNIKITENP
jgi:hypothetical protein